MLTNRGNNGNVVLGIGGVQEGVKAASPGRDLWGKAVKLVAQAGVGHSLPKKVRVPPTITAAEDTNKMNDQNSVSNCARDNFDRM